MLNFLLGRAGTGKSAELYRRLCKADGKAMMLVPDQFVFEAERIIAEKTDEKTENIKICGFSSLSEEILRTYRKRKSYADFTAKHIIMQDTVRELKRGFKYFSTAANRKGFASYSLSAVEEMKRAGVSPDALLSVSENIDGSLKDKINEIGLIYGLYNDKLTRLYDDREDNLLLAADAAAENDVFKDYTVFIDGFDSFSGSQLKFLAPVIEQSKDCHVSLCLDRDAVGELNFATAENTLQQLSRIAETSLTEISCEDLKGNERYKSDELLYLRDVLSGDKKGKYSGEVKDISCKMCVNADTEVDYVFAKIKKLCRMGYRYSDINILCPSGANYVNSITSSALRYDVPVFADMPSPISRKPLIKYLLYLLAVADDPCGKNVLRLIKSGFARTTAEGGKTRTISLKEINELQSYCDKWDIGHLSFAKPFSHIETEKEKALDALRESVVAPLISFKKKSEGKTGSEITRFFTEYLFESADIKAAIQGKCQDRSTRALKYNKELTEEYNQLWSIVCDMLESADKAMQDSTYTLKEYAEILKSCSELISLSKPPQVLDSVLFGDIHRTRSRGAKVVFIIGADENSLPNCNTDSEGVFSLQEYSVLADNDIDLFADGDKKYTAELCCCYKALTLPSEKLFITYCGNASQMGEAVETVVDVFNINMSENDISTLGAEFFCESMRSAEKQLSIHVYDNKTCQVLSSALRESGDGAYLKLLSDATKKDGPFSNCHSIDSARAQLLFGFDKMAPTAMKDLNSCRFKYFCHYGLSLKSPDSKKLNPQNIGNIVHNVMDACFKSFYDGKSPNRVIEDEVIKAAVDIALAKYREKNLMDEQYHTARFNVLFNSLKGICFYLLKYMTLELSKSDFRPSYFELSLKEPSTSPDGFNAMPFKIPIEVNGRREEIELYGTVDRVDIAELSKTDENGNAFTERQIRVIDYKTGKEIFGLDRVYYGLSLQLLIYLFALAEGNPDYIPSCATYYPSGDACVQKDVANPDEEKLRDIWLQKHGEEGIVVRDTVGFKEKSNYDSSSTFNKKGERVNYFCATPVSYGKYIKLKKHITDTIGKNVSEIKQGQVSATPIYDDEKSISCTFCEYSSVCGARKEHSRNIKDCEALAFENDIKTEREGESDE